MLVFSFFRLIVSVLSLFVFGWLCLKIRKCMGLDCWMGLWIVVWLMSDIYFMFRLVRVGIRWLFCGLY